jgi:hypothetical protein
MNLNKAEALKEIAEIIVLAANTVRNAGGDEGLLRSTIRNKLFDEELVNPSDRKQVLDKVNSEMGLKYSMNNIKGARRLDTPVGEPKPVVVTELKGSVDIPTILSNPETYVESPLITRLKQHAEQGSTGFVTTTPTLREGDKLTHFTIDADNGLVFHFGYDTEGRPIGYVCDKEGNLISRKGPDINPVTIPEAAVTEPLPESSTTTATQPTAITEEQTMSNANIAALEAKGFTTPLQRSNLLVAFAAATQVAPSLNPDPKTHDDFLGRLKESQLADILQWTTTLSADDLNTILVGTADTQAAAEAAWLKANERNSDLESSWIGVGAAIVGGGLAMLAKGEVTLGGLIGTAAGAGGAYFLSDKFDDKFEGDFGRYLVAGSIGLALGGVGARLGGVLLDSVVPVTLLGGQKDVNANTTVMPSNVLNQGTALQVESAIPGM